jgi:serine/threonine-protein kinase
MMKDLSNTYLGQYYLTEVIGRGSTSVVYKAYQSSLARYVAVKVLLHHLDKQYAARFIREAHAVAQLQHPNILPIYDYGEEKGLRYLVMQYVESGTTLDDRLTGQPIAPIAALRLMLPLLAALEYAHSHGVVHRDIKPANIMLPQPDWPMLADFGIAKLIDESDQLTPPGQSVGTAIYMAPERANSTIVDARTDLYSVGVVLFEMLTGRVPYEGISPVEVLRKHVREPLPRPRDLNPLLPAPAEPVLQRALAKRLEDRYQSAGAMAKDLQRLIGQIERLEAQEQLNRMLQQPLQPAAALPGQLNPYETREFTTDALPVVQHPRATPPAPPIAATAAADRQFIPGNAVPKRSRWLGGLLAGAVVLAVLGAVLMARSASGRSSAAAPTAAPPSATALTGAIEAPTLPVEPAPPPTAATPTAPAEATAIPIPTTIPAPVATEAPITTAVPAPPALPPAVATTPQVSQAGDTATIVFEDTDWQGGFRRPGGQTYGGRTSTWIYGTSTEYSVMRARFDLGGRFRFAGTATLTIEGMDSEGRTKTPIQILVNGVEIYNGPNPLPDDDQPLETGTWASQSWTFDATLLHAGQNEISISNLAEGAFSRPPFFMLDYAELSGNMQ